jgi:hypothetical protein
MDKQQKKTICGLLTRLVAGEAREIYFKDDKRRVCRKYNKTTKEVDIPKIKSDLVSFIEENKLVLNQEAVKRYLLRYLEDHEKIATANPSYGILRQRIESGEYDFSFVKNNKPNL